MAHILSPHPPFLWDEEGNEHDYERTYYGTITGFLAVGGTRDEFKVGLRNQTRVIDRLLRKTVDGILASQRGNPPVILIQSDHGPGAHLSDESLAESDVSERFPNLSAYYFPDGDASGLYPTISPVNSFRVILNKYFGLELPMVADQAYYTTYGRPFDFIEVTDSLLKSP